MADLQSTPPPHFISQGDSSANGRGASPAQPAAPHRPGSSGRRPRRWLQKRVGIPAGVIVLVLILIISINSNDGGLFDHHSTHVGPGDSGSSNAPTVAAVGQSVLDGSFAFVVTSAPQQPTRTFTDRSGAIQTAQGMYVIVRVTVTNVGYDPRSLNATNQFLINARGQRYATSAAMSSLRGTEQLLVDKINPGQTVNEAPLLFDVTTGTTISSIELHDSATSNGVKIKLS